MRTAVLNWIVRMGSLAWLTGPIFDKEMRVSSRRRRNYVLRFAYITVFTFTLSLVWLNLVAHSSTSTYQTSRMAIAGRMIMFFVLWFEFIAVQIVAIVMLSTSISDEIYGRTLGVLMTTPIGSTQIVVGKLLSKLLQLTLLLAITLPLLAVVRVFGGVSWEYVVCTLCVTLATGLLVGSLSLLFSIFTRRAYGVILAVILTLMAVFLLLPVLTLALLHDIIPEPAFEIVLCYVNPYFAMGKAMAALTGTVPMSTTHWQAHCGISLGTSVLLLFLSATLVRQAALRQAMGQTGLWSGRKSDDDAGRSGRIRRVKGSAVLWKERRSPLLGRRRTGMLVVIFLALTVLGLTYYAGFREEAFRQEEFHAVYVVILFGLGMLFTAVLSATCITSEKESQTWTLLLTTAAGDWEIIAGKLIGALRRCLPAWLFLAGHVLFFAMTGFIAPTGVVQLAILVIWATLFLSSTGLYFSTRFKHTTTAVIANMGLAVGLWAVVPLLLGLLLVGLYDEPGPLEVYLDMNPFVHAVVITMATAHGGGIAAYDWVQGGLSSLAKATGWILLTFTLYVGLSTAFIVRAAARLRLDPF